MRGQQFSNIREANCGRPDVPRGRAFRAGVFSTELSGGMYVPLTLADFMDGDYIAGIWKQEPAAHWDAIHKGKMVLA